MTQVQHLVQALQAARDVLQQDRDELFASATLGGDPSTMDEMTRPFVERFDDLLARIDDALGVAPLASEKAVFGRLAADAAMILFNQFLDAIDSHGPRNDFTRAVDHVFHEAGPGAARRMALALGDQIEAAWATLPQHDRLAMSWPTFVVEMGRRFDWAECQRNLTPPTASPETASAWARELRDGGEITVEKLDVRSADQPASKM